MALGSSCPRIGSKHKGINGKDNNLTLICQASWDLIGIDAQGYSPYWDNYLFQLDTTFGCPQLHLSPSILPLTAFSGLGFSGDYKAERLRTFEGSATANVVRFVVRNRSLRHLINLTDLAIR